MVLVFPISPFMRNSGKISLINLHPSRTYLFSLHRRIIYGEFHIHGTLVSCLLVSPPVTRLWFKKL